MVVKENGCNEKKRLNWRDRKMGVRERGQEEVEQ
jgi:hypothetical protein